MRVDGNSYQIKSVTYPGESSSNGPSLVRPAVDGVAQGHDAGEGGEPPAEAHKGLGRRACGSPALALPLPWPLPWRHGDPAIKARRRLFALVAVPDPSAGVAFWLGGAMAGSMVR